MIPVPVAAITRANKLGSNQPEQLIFTNRQGRLIRDNNTTGVAPERPPDGCEAGIDDDVELPGVGVDDFIEQRGTDQAPQIVEIDDLDTIDPDPAPIEPAIANAEVPATVVEQPIPTETPETTTAAEPAETLALRHSTRARTKTQQCMPSMAGTRCSCATAQFEEQAVLNPGAHVLLVQEDFFQSDPGVVATSNHDTTVSQSPIKGVGHKSLPSNQLRSETVARERHAQAKTMAGTH